MTGSEAQLDSIRRAIDALDAELIVLLNRRARRSFEVAAVKCGEAEPRYYRPEREAALIRRLAAANPGPFSNRDLTRLFREIVSSCRTLEQRLVVGCATVGSACAAIGHFGGAVDIRSLPDAEQALRSVERADCDFTVVEFFRAGLASPIMVEVLERGLSLCGEWYATCGERFVVVGREPVPPTGDDWTSFILPTGRLAAVESWCSRSKLEMRSVPVAGAVSSSVAEVAAHASDSRLARIVARHAAAVLGAYPDARDGDGAAG